MNSTNLFRAVVLVLIVFAAAAVGIARSGVSDPMPIITTVGSLATLIATGLLAQAVFNNTAVQQATQAKVETVVAKVDTVVTQSHEAAAIAAQVITTAQETALQLERIGVKVDTTAATTEKTKHAVNGEMTDFKATLKLLADQQAQLAAALGELRGIRIGREQVAAEVAHDEP